MEVRVGSKRRGEAVFGKKGLRSRKLVRASSLVLWP